MFKARTVIVLGAGASMPYQFPSGSRLIDNIISHRQNGHLLEALNHPKQGRYGELVSQDLIEFTEELRNAHPPSIDTWLNRRRERFWQVGKAAIAFDLMRFESKTTLMDRLGGYHPNSADCRELWYGHFFNLLGESPEEVVANKDCLSIVTFNYDRSFEEFAFAKFMAYFGITAREAALLVSSLNIHHVYGQLGTLRWQHEHLRTRRKITSFGLAA